LRWLGHVERMDPRRLPKKIHEADLDGDVLRGRPRRTYPDQIEQVLEESQVKSTVNRLYTLDFIPLLF
jgi:hypothetical protein